MKASFLERFFCIFVSFFMTKCCITWLLIKETINERDVNLKSKIVMFRVHNRELFTAGDFFSNYYRFFLNKLCHFYT